MDKPHLSSVLHVLLCVAVSCILLCAPHGHAMNDNLENESFPRALNLQNYQRPKDFVIDGGVRRSLILNSRVDYEGDYNTAGTANTNTGNTPPSTPVP
ncbi:hypothetical protein KP509_29G072900 [Ceratopteris richardii]|uniref:Uncharacterized protein n=1 Tax=Ceratopteris richardii TaxID=49495 RepID=A0A8T2R9R6_CERRI|nr:hypothetical protein KP509_29G072900 [Ceratopteris richardii]